MLIRLSYDDELLSFLCDFDGDIPADKVLFVYYII